MTDRKGRLVSFSKLEGAEHDGASPPSRVSGFGFIRTGIEVDP